MARFVGILVGSTMALLASAAHAAPPSATDPQTAAAESAAHVRQYAGSAAQIKDNLVQPLLTENTLTTFDGQPFAAQIGCAASTRFLEILIQPAPSGDISYMSLAQDTNLDRVLDQHYRVPVPISGVCANGIISCEPGTWNQCRSFSWVADAQNRVALKRAPLSDLGGCYCVNNHCGNGLVSRNLARLLGDLGGGAVASLLRANPAYAVSDVKTQGASIRYFAQDTQSCMATPAVDPVATLRDPRTMDPSIFAEQQKPDGLYQLLTTSVVAKDNRSEAVRCRVTRTLALEEVGVNDILRYDGGVGGLRSCGTQCFELVIGRIGNNYWSAPCGLFEHPPLYFYVHRPERIVSATLLHTQFDDWMQVFVNDTLLWNGPYGTWTNPWSDTARPPGRCELSTSWQQAPNVDFTALVKRTGRIELKTRAWVADKGEGYAYAQVIVDTSCRLDEQIHDGCQAYAQQPECRLIEEVVDGVQTYRNYHPTNLTPLPSTLSLTGQHCDLEVTRNWLNKERRYLCTRPQQHAFDPALQRAAQITDSTTVTGYTDYRLNEASGEWSSGAVRVDFPSASASAGVACTPVCKTRRLRQANDVAGLGPVQDQRLESGTYDFFYHECEASTCPADPNEEIIAACQCLNEFAEATAIMATLRSAARDTLCTSGTPQPLP